MAIGFSVSCGTCGSKRCRCNGGRLSGEVCTTTDKYRNSEMRYGKTVEFIDSVKSMVTERSKTGPFFAFTAGQAPSLEADPFRFEIIEQETSGDYTLVKVVYPGCTNYEGVKILLLRNSDKEVNALDGLDPHFLECESNGLIARFVPSAEGWSLGLKLLFMLAD